jgi:hypothetical protein
MTDAYEAAAASVENVATRIACATTPRVPGSGLTLSIGHTLGADPGEG